MQEDRGRPNQEIHGKSRGNESTENSRQEQLQVAAQERGAQNKI